MKSSKIIGRYQVIRKYKPKYDFHFKQNWLRESKILFPKAYMSKDVRNSIKSPESMIDSTRYSDMINDNIIDKSNKIKTDWSVLIDKHPDKIMKKPRVYKFSQYDRFTFGISQACLLTKTTIDPLPYINKVESNLSDNSKRILERFVMKANWWITDENKLPKKFSSIQFQKFFQVEYGIIPKHIIRSLFNDMLAYSDHLNKSSSKLFNEDQQIQTHYFYQGNKIQFDEQFDLVISDYHPLTEFENKRRPFSVDDILLKSGNINPLIDINTTLYYPNKNNYGWKQSSNFVQYPHIITINLDKPNVHDDFLEPEAKQITQSEKDAIAVMKCFSYCVSVARNLYGDEEVNNCKGQLPQSINLLAVASDGVDFNFICYQLNTTDFSNNDISNVAWIDKGNQFYEKIRHDDKPSRFNRYENLNLKVFRKLLAYYNYSC